MRPTSVVKKVERGSGDREVDVHHLLGGSGILAEIFNDDGRARGRHLDEPSSFESKLGATERLGGYSTSE